MNLPRLVASQTTAVICSLGTAQTIAWASTYYLPAILAAPMARDLGISTVWVFAAFSGAMVISALLAPWGGARIDRLGGRSLLVASSLLFATGLVVLGLMQGPWSLCLGWLLIGTGMGIGLYESAFAALAAIYGSKARPSITGITLLAGFASTVGWPLSAIMEAEIGWRGACFVWAAIHLVIALPLNAILPPGVQPRPVIDQTLSPEEKRRSRFAMAVLAYLFAVTYFTSTSMASHLPRLLEAYGATTAVAVAAGALIGPAQVGARIVEFSLLKSVHPLISAKFAAAAHPVAVLALLLVGAPAAYAFTLVHGAGNGILTISKGTLPLALFGPAGYGYRQGLLNAPGRFVQSFAPLIFGFALDRYGADSIWLTGLLGVTAVMALMALKVVR